LTARDELHASDQALEQVLLSPGGTLIVPHSIISAAHDQARLGKTLHSLGYGAAQFTPALIATDKPGVGSTGVATSMATFVCRPRDHAPIARTPRTLGDLHELRAVGGDDLVGAMRERIWEWKSPTALPARLVLLLLVPLRRGA